MDNQDAYDNSTINEYLNNDDNNIEVSNSKINKKIACVRVSLRSNNLITLSDDMDEYYQSHFPGSINIYLFTNGLIKIFVGNKLEQEATLQSSNLIRIFNNRCWKFKRCSY